MNLSELLSKGLVEKFQPNPKDIKNEIDIAKNDLSSAKKMIAIDEWGWAHNAAYNAMLQVKGVTGIFDLHIWTITSGMDALSAHVVTLDIAKS